MFIIYRRTSAMTRTSFLIHVQSDTIALRVFKLRYKTVVSSVRFWVNQLASRTNRVFKRGINVCR